MKKLLLSAVSLFVVLCFHSTSFAQDPVAIDDEFTTHGSIVLNTRANDIGTGSAETEPAIYGNVSYAVGIPPQHVYHPPAAFRRQS